MKRLALDGDMNLIRSLDLIYASSVGFFLAKPTKLGFLVMDLGETNFLDGGVANIFGLSCDDFSEIISVSKMFDKLLLFILINLKVLSHLSF
jgi:hypothetical protein